jgi:2-C-methyl-D-erythritol 4-phosphate cytidylyltransferase
VLIHDVVHPFASAQLFRAVLAAVDETGAAIASLRPTDFVYRNADVGERGPGVVAERVEGAWIAQSPKAFRRDILEQGYGLLEARSAGGSTVHRDSPSGDPGSLDLLRLAGGRVVTVPGDVRNIKITTAEDLRHAESLLNASS